jgi:peptide/nickel transport system permease protein
VIALVLRRALQGALTVAFAATLSFFLLHLAPGDPIAAALDHPGVTEAVRQHWRAVYGLDRPVTEQFVRYLAGIPRGDLGWSFSQTRPVSAVLADALPNTLVLAGTGLALSLAVGVALGVVQALRRGRAADRLLGAVAMFFYSVPEFWLALALLVLFAFRLSLFPSGGARDVVSYEYFTPLERLRDRLWHLALPAVTIALGTAAAIARHQRGALLDVAGEDFVRTARAKGCSERRVLLRHALRNALLPTITLLGLAFPALVGGVVFVEKIFSWPGMGLVAVNAVTARDYALVTGVVTLGSAAVALGALVADVLHAAVDPRVREQDA